MKIILVLILLFSPIINAKEMTGEELVDAMLNMNKQECYAIITVNGRTERIDCVEDEDGKKQLNYRSTDTVNKTTIIIETNK